MLVAVGVELCLRLDFIEPSKTLGGFMFYAWGERFESGNMYVLYEIRLSMENEMKAVVCVVLAGIVSGAGAQSASLSIVSNPEYVSGSMMSSFTLSIYAQVDFGTHIAGGEFAVTQVTDSFSHITDMEGAAANWGLIGQNDRGYAGGGDYRGLVFGQLIAPPFFPPSEDSRISNQQSVLIGTVVVSIDPNFGGFNQFDVTFGQGPFVLEIYDEADGSLTQLTTTDVSYGSVVVGIPVPSTLAIVGLGKIVLGRRRR